MTKRGQDRRAHERTEFEFRSVHLRARLGPNPLDILNIGRSGLLGQGSGVPKRGARAVLSLPGLGEIDAMVVWNRGELVGLSFERPIGTEDFQAFLTSVRGESTGSRP